MTVRGTELSVVIPTYQRGRVVLDILEALLNLPVPPDEILVVDQTEEHPPKVLDVFQSLEMGIVRRIVLPTPSIPHAMNVGLCEAKGKTVLFLDDDIIPSPNLIKAHADHHDGSHAAVCGQVLQPGQKPESRSIRYVSHSGLWRDLDFPFNSMELAGVSNVMAGNLSVNREIALSIGGFDEQFLGTAYRFETEFARRLISAGHSIRFVPDASIDHLRLSAGGTRNVGDHLSAPSPMHSVGDYYFSLRCGRGLPRVAYMIHRLFRETVNRYYLRHPWRVPKKFWSELRGLELAMRLNRAGPRLILSKKEESHYE